SFLAPAQDAACSVTETRKKAMEIIVKMHGHLHQLIPNQIGVFDDAFNINCVGDTFQSLNIPTVLFEAGHYADDYDREVVREFIYHSLMVGIDYIASTEITGIHYENYFSIPQNQKLFYDIIIRNAKVDGQTADIAIQFKELLVKDRVAFVPVVEKIADLSSFYAHKELDANHNPILTVDGLEIKKNYENDFVLLNNERFLLKP
ncbi:MAG TPA: hypothetical protein VKZ98_09155, partial [Aquaticitalea sp.]|nr:hypothetical protein [Aquaticitalea sp.]